MKIILFSLLLISNFLTLSYAESKQDCSGLNHPNYQDEYRTCLRLNLASAAADAGVDCVDCFEQQQKQPASWVQALSVIAGPLAYLGGAYVTAKYQYQSQEAWANAYKDGNTQCTNRFNTYLDYTTQMGANPVTASEAQQLTGMCNGNSYGLYSGMNGYSSNSYGGFANPWSSAGYSANFMGGMIGPNYGGMGGNMYGSGIGVGMYNGMNSNLYGGAGFGMYGNIGMGTSPYGMSYGSPYAGMNGASMNYAGMGMNSMNSGGITNYGASPYAAGNLSATVGVSATAGYSF